MTNARGASALMEKWPVPQRNAYHHHLVSALQLPHLTGNVVRLLIVQPLRQPHWHQGVMLRLPPLVQWKMIHHRHWPHLLTRTKMNFLKKHQQGPLHHTKGVL